MKKIRKIMSSVLVVALMIASVPLSGINIDAGELDIKTQEYTIESGKEINNTLENVEHSGVLIQHYIKIVSPGTGTATFNMNVKNLYTGNTPIQIVKFENEQKEELGYELKSLTMPVKKGEVYYIYITGMKLQYSIKYNFKKVKAFSTATTKKTAPLLKKKKKAKGLIFNSDKSNSANWYKIKVNKKTKIKVSVKYDKKLGEPGIFWDYELYSKKGKKIKWTTDGDTKKATKVKKGTYYIKVKKKKMEDISKAAIYKLWWK